LVIISNEKESAFCAYYSRNREKNCKYTWNRWTSSQQAYDENIYRFDDVILRRGDGHSIMT